MSGARGRRRKGSGRLGMVQIGRSGGTAPSWPARRALGSLGRRCQAHPRSRRTAPVESSGGSATHATSGRNARGSPARGRPPDCPAAAQCELDTLAGDAFSQNFSDAVALDAERLVVGDGLADGLTHDAGAAFIFRREGDAWVLEAKLVAHDGQPGDYFGRALALDGDGLVIGSGAAHLLERVDGAWLLGARYTAPVPLVLTGFGRVSALHGDVVAVGQPASGTASLHAATTALPTWVFLGDGLAGDLGTPRLVGAGTLAAGDPVTITLSGAQPDSLAILVVGFSTVNDLFEGGVLVPSPDALVKNLPTGATGSSVIAATAPALPAGLTFLSAVLDCRRHGPFGVVGVQRALGDGAVGR